MFRKTIQIRDYGVPNVVVGYDRVRSVHPILYVYAGFGRVVQWNVVRAYKVTTTYLVNGKLYLDYSNNYLNNYYKTNTEELLP